MVTDKQIEEMLKGNKLNPKDFIYILDGYYHKDNHDVEWNQSKEYYYNSLKNR